MLTTAVLAAAVAYLTGKAGLGQQVWFMKSFCCLVDQVVCDVEIERDSLSCLLLSVVEVEQHN